MTTKQAFVRRVVGHVTSWTSLCQTHRSDECRLQMWRTSWQRGGWRKQYWGYGAVWEAGVTRDAFKMNTLPSSHWCLLTSSAITLHYAPLWTWTAGVTKSCPFRASRSPSNDKIDMKDFYSYKKKSALKPDESEKQITGYTFTIYGNLIWKSIYLNKKVEGRMRFNTAFIQEVTAAVWFSVWGGQNQCPMPLMYCLAFLLVTSWAHSSPDHNEQWSHGLNVRGSIAI